MAAESWNFQIEASARREISRLPDGLDQEAVETIESLLDDPYPEDSEKLEGYEDVYRIKFGPTSARKGLRTPQYRIIYSVNEHRRLIRVWRVRPRSSAYEGMRNP